MTGSTKQSIVSEGRLDCFVAFLLAMTAPHSLHSHQAVIIAAIVMLSGTTHANTSRNSR
jgi:hypothetical protein